jgi:hypothetical protein
MEMSDYVGNIRVGSEFYIAYIPYSPYPDLTIYHSVENSNPAFNRRINIIFGQIKKSCKII